MQCIVVQLVFKLKSMLKLIKEFAIMSHENVNHKYGSLPYQYHLQMVVEVAEKYIDCVMDIERENVLMACWLHDTIEYCRLTYNDILKVSNQIVAEAVYALSNEKGRTREDRANEKYYQGIKETPYATFIKLCDRIANVKHSKSERSKMFEVYQKEHFVFITSIITDKSVYSEMIDELDELLFFEQNVI